MANVKQDKQEQEPWCSIDLDPGTLTSLCKKLGIKDVQISERSKLDGESLIDYIRPLYGVIVFFTSRKERIDQGTGDNSGSENIFFANQVISEACPTQAILSVVLNSDPPIDMGDQLRQLKQNMKTFDPLRKGESIVSDTRLCEAQKSFIRAHIRDLGMDRREKTSMTRTEGDIEYVLDNVERYISYIWVEENIWELDGFKKAPVRLRKCSKSDWPDIAKSEIQTRMNDGGYGENIRFMMVTRSIYGLMKQQEYLKNELEKRLSNLNPDWKAEPEATKWEEEYAEQASRASNVVLDPPDNNISEETIKEDLRIIDKEKRSKILVGWRLEAMEKILLFREAYISSENKAEYHNYLPFIVELLKRLDRTYLGNILPPPSPEEEEGQFSEQSSGAEGEETVNN